LVLILVVVDLDLDLERAAMVLALQAQALVLKALAQVLVLEDMALALVWEDMALARVWEVMVLAMVWEVDMDQAMEWGVMVPDMERPCVARPRWSQDPRVEKWMEPMFLWNKSVDFLSSVTAPVSM